MADPNDDELVITVLSPSSSREELIEALELVTREAQREQTVIGSAEWPSRWDRLHAFIDDLLTELAGR